MIYCVCVEVIQCECVEPEKILLMNSDVVLRTLSPLSLADYGRSLNSTSHFLESLKAAPNRMGTTKRNVEL